MNIHTQYQKFNHIEKISRIQEQLEFNNKVKIQLSKANNHNAEYSRSVGRMVRPKFETMSSIEDDIERIKEELSRQKEKQKMGTLI